MLHVILDGLQSATTRGPISVQHGLTTERPFEVSAMADNTTSE